jgi:lincosamide nucleotidyltransferase A/C/D/E
MAEAVRHSAKSSLLSRSRSRRYVPRMREADVLDLCHDLSGAGITFWLMGGWGVDALLQHQTRPHHDVDLLVDVRSLNRFLQRLDALGFTFAYLWEEESRPLGAAVAEADAWDGADPDQPTAFVYRHADGREVDVHVVATAADGSMRALWESRNHCPAKAVPGEGIIGGQRVPCLSVEMQRSAHTGYDLPPEHVEDLRRLAELSAR